MSEHHKRLFVIAMFVAVALGHGRLVAQDDQVQQQKEDAAYIEAIAASERQAILDDPFDFSKDPVLPTIEPPAQVSIRKAIADGVSFLLDTQNPDGSWGSSDASRPFQVYAPIPGAHHAFRAAVTGMCVSALIETQSSDERVPSAIDQGEAWLLEHLMNVRRATGDTMYNVWAHAYGIQALVRLYRRADGDSAKQDRLRAAIEQQMKMLDRYESVDGGWGYYDFLAQAAVPTSASTSFVNASVLIALKEAEELGIEQNGRTIRRAIDSTNRQQLRDYSYMYGEYLKYRPAREINRPGGSLARSHACNVALRRWGDDSITDSILKNWLYRLYVRNGWLSIGRKRPIPHEAWFQVAGYFYYYGHFYAAYAIDELEPEDRPPYQDHLAAIILQYQETDGSWWDYPFYDYHRPYGTAYALMTLQRCLHSSE
jgi:hypothetical protein